MHLTTGLRDRLIFDVKPWQAATANTHGQRYLLACKRLHLNMEKRPDTEPWIHAGGGRWWRPAFADRAHIGDKRQGSRPSSYEPAFISFLGHAAVYNW